MYKLIALIFPVCLAIIIATWKISRKKITPEQDADGCKIRQLYPAENDPEYAQFKDNKPDWKPKRAQNN